MKKVFKMQNNVNKIIQNQTYKHKIFEHFSYRLNSVLASASRILQPPDSSLQRDNGHFQALHNITFLRSWTSVNLIFHLITFSIHVNQSTFVQTKKVINTVYHMKNDDGGDDEDD